MCYSFIDCCACIKTLKIKLNLKMFAYPFHVLSHICCILCCYTNLYSIKIYITINRYIKNKLRPISCDLLFIQYILYNLLHSLRK